MTKNVVPNSDLKDENERNKGRRMIIPLTNQQKRTAIIIGAFAFLIYSFTQNEAVTGVVVWFILLLIADSI